MGFCLFHEIPHILAEISKIAEMSTFRPTRPACRPGGAARLSAAEPTLVASDPMLGAPHRAQGLPDLDLGATGSRPRGQSGNLPELLPQHGDTAQEQTPAAPHKRQSPMGDSPLGPEKPKIIGRVCL